MKLLLTNDDGIDAEGLAALERAMSRFGDVTIVAPEQPLSGCSHRVTTDRPLAVRQTRRVAFAVEGAPADCVRLGLLHLAPEADWVVAGINAGGNLGVDVHMSGTVAAAREAALMGKPAVAFSQYRQRGGSFDWPRAEELAERVFAALVERAVSRGDFWNVNFPHPGGGKSLPEVVDCFPDPHPLAVKYEEQDGQFVYRGVYQERKRRPGSDVDVCFAGHIAATKLSCAVRSSG